MSHVETRGGLACDVRVPGSGIEQCPAVPAVNQDVLTNASHFTSLPSVLMCTTRRIICQLSQTSDELLQGSQERQQIGDLFGRHVAQLQVRHQ